MSEAILPTSDWQPPVPVSHLFDEARRLHLSQPAVQAFCPFPTDARPVACVPDHHPLTARLMRPRTADTPLVAATRAALPYVQWGRAYDGTGADSSFLDRFAYFCLIGPSGGLYHSVQMAAWLLYMSPGLHYPFHHHPAEEMYYILKGQATFETKGDRRRVKRAGDTVIHTAHAPHATTNRRSSMFAYVIWRTALDTPPIWTY